VTVALEKEKKQEIKEDDKEEEKEYIRSFLLSDVVELHATCIYRAQEKWVHTDTVS
jgi:hypothetical protein